MPTTPVSYSGPLTLPAEIIKGISAPLLGSSSSTPVPLAQNLAGGVVGSAYSETIAAQGGVSPYSFALFSGTLPAGTSLNSSTGVISGTPTTAATYTFAIRVTDSNGSTGTATFQIIISTASVSSSGGALVWVG